MHRNGVKVLGTFIIEPGKTQVERMLDQVDGEFVIAKQLATMAEVFGFDGWLLNIELEFPKSIKNLTGKINAFIRSLKRLLGPEGNVVWCGLSFLSQFFAVRPCFVKLDAGIAHSRKPYHDSVLIQQELC